MNLFVRNDPGAVAPTHDGRGPTRRTTGVAYAALGWVVLFFAFHVYWYLGGSLASPGELPPLTPGTSTAADGTTQARMQIVAWIVEIPVDAAWPIGALVCLAVARGWRRGRLARTITPLLWIGSVVLLLRGGSGILDDVTRTTGLLANGITGLSLQATTGHAQLRWADWTIDSYFLLGGIVFGALTLLYRASRRRERGDLGGDRVERLP